MADKEATSIINGTGAIISYIGNSSNIVFFQKEEGSLKFFNLCFIAEPFSHFPSYLDEVEGKNI